MHALWGNGLMSESRIAQQFEDHRNPFSLGKETVSGLKTPELRSLQVVYPALSAKVKNVTSSYSVEHDEEVGDSTHIL